MKPEKKVTSLKIVFEDGGDYAVACEVGLDKDELAKYIERAFKPDPAEPLIEKKSHRGVLRAAARISGTGLAHVRKSDYEEVVIFEFTGKELCAVELKDEGINIDHDGWYTIAELCGEEEE